MDSTAQLPTGLLQHLVLQVEGISKLQENKTHTPFMSRTAGLEQVLMSRTAGLEQVFMSRTAGLEQVFMSRTAGLEQVFMSRTAGLEQVFMSRTAGLEQVFMSRTTRTTDIEQVLMSRTRDIKQVLPGDLPWLPLALLSVVRGYHVLGAKQKRKNNGLPAVIIQFH